MSSDSQRTESTDMPSAQGYDLTTGSIPRHLVTFTIPMLGGNVIQMAYNLVNGYWVGKGLGETAMAAITVSFPAFFVLLAVAIGLTMATGILGAQYYGARDFSRFRQLVQTSVVLIGISSILCTLSAYLFAEPILRLMQTPTEVLPVAVSFMKVFVWHIPFVFGMFLIASLLRAVGDSKTPLYFQASCLVLAAVLDPILMFGWLGFPRLGLNGAGVVTIVTNALALIAIYLYLRSKSHMVVPRWRAIRPDWHIGWLMVKIGLPSSVQNLLVSTGMFIIVVFVNAFGEKATAAYGIAQRIDQFAFLPAMTIGMAVSTLVGQNIGAGKYERVHEIFKWGMLLACCITIPAMIIFMSLPGSLMARFTDSREVVDLGIRYLRIMGGGYLVLTGLFVSNGVINGAGRTFITTIIAAIGLWLVRVPLLLYLPKAFKSADGIWYSMVIGFAVGVVLSVGYYYSGNWRKPIITESPAPEASEIVEAPPVMPDIIPVPETLTE